MAKRPPSPLAEPVPESLRELFGANLRRERERQGVLQKDLADAAGVSQGFLSLIESTGRNVTLDIAERLATSLGVEVRDLLKPRSRQ